MIDLGWLGVLLLFLAPIPQFFRLLRHKVVGNVSFGTYWLVVGGVIGQLTHAITIGDPLFITSNSLSLVLNSSVLFLMWKHKKRGA